MAGDVDGALELTTIPIEREADNVLRTAAGVNPVALELPRLPSL